MKIVIIGANGTIGQAVAAALAPRHQIVRVGKTSDEHQVDIVLHK
jgi:nucleoside-diphosphate-sugar epimerase